MLWLDGYDLSSLPLLERKKILKQIIPKNDVIKLCDYYNKNPQRILIEAQRSHLEGIIAKKANSTYQFGIRSKDWLKLKIQIRHEVVIGGFTKNENTPKLFSSLLVGVYDSQGLQYIGKLGTGFNKLTQEKLWELFSSLIVKKCPFTFIPDINKPSRFNPNPPPAKAIWLKPKLICEVSYTEMTRDGIIRHPSYKGLRDDKNVKDVHAEIPIESKSQKNAIISIKPSKTKNRKTLLNPNEDTQVKIINQHEVKFKHLKKVFWPQYGYTKCELINYYYQIVPYLLPYLINRPQTLNRFPNGIDGVSFYQKDISKIAPPWIKRFPYHTSLDEDKNFLVIQNEEDILWMINLGVIEVNPWNSTIYKPNNPTWCMIDIDPSPSNTFEQVIKTARVTKDILDELNIKGYCKTSGSTGLHIYIPLANKYTYSLCQSFGRLLAKEVNVRLPKITSVERYVVKRPDKIYIDFLQNRPKATVAAPYSVRPRAEATVSMPLHWEEVKKGLKPTKYNLMNAMSRLQKDGDLFKSVLGKSIDLIKVLKLLEGNHR